MKAELFLGRKGLSGSQYVGQGSDTLLQLLKEFQKINLEEMTDFQLLQWYRRGWNDEGLGIIAVVVPPEGQRAYNIGKLDYIVGDDVRSVDYQTEEEILKKIKE